MEPFQSDHTRYIIHPEEILADHFALLVLSGKTWAQESPLVIRLHHSSRAWDYTLELDKTSDHYPVVAEFKLSGIDNEAR